MHRCSVDPLARALCARARNHMDSLLAPPAPEDALLLWHCAAPLQAQASTAPQIFVSLYYMYILSSARLAAELARAEDLRDRVLQVAHVEFYETIAESSISGRFADHTDRFPCTRGVESTHRRPKTGRDSLGPDGSTCRPRCGR